MWVTCMESSHQMEQLLKSMLWSNINTLHDTVENVLKICPFCYLRLDVTTTHYMPASDEDIGLVQVTHLTFIKNLRFVQFRF